MTQTMIAPVAQAQTRKLYRFLIHYARTDLHIDALTTEGIRFSSGKVVIDAGNPDMECEYPSYQALFDTLNKRLYNRPWRIEVLDKEQS